jgi:[calcium/calmodulin-dependent protein kinase] kinase
MKSVRRDTVIDKYSRLKANRIALTAPAPSEPAVVDKLNTTELKIKKEIAIMKKLAHPNVVRLFEVIDDRMKEKVYMGALSISSLWDIPLGVIFGNIIPPSSSSAKF